MKIVFALFLSIQVLYAQKTIPSANKDSTSITLQVFVQKNHRKTPIQKKVYVFLDGKRLGVLQTNEVGIVKFTLNKLGNFEFVVIHYNNQGQVSLLFPRKTLKKENLELIINED